MCGSTCFGRNSAHHQEPTTSLGASGFNVGAWQLERCWSWSGNPRPTTLQPPLANGKTRGSYCSCTLLMMCGEALETCWATHKCQVINLWNCCILLVDLFESNRIFLLALDINVSSVLVCHLAAPLCNKYDSTVVLVRSIKVHWDWICTPIIFTSTLDWNKEEPNATLLIDFTNIRLLPTTFQTSYFCQWSF